jgi:DNA mismatch repair protein MutS
LIRSAEILKVLEDSRLKNQQRNALKKTESKPVYQMSMFQTEDPVFNEMKKSLNQLDINAMSPIEALIKLQLLKSLLD